MSRKISEYIENYYIPLMKLDSNSLSIKNFIEDVKGAEETRVTDSIVKSYQSLVDYIRENVQDKKPINVYFNRMRCDIHHTFSNESMLPYVYFV
jgi:hypothetical protein